MIRKLSVEVQSTIRSGITLTDTVQCVVELVENALDAKATCIAVRVDLENYMIQVVDNGHGLTKEELDLIGTRYMTSKCNSLTDLTTKIKYYGFRGESLASLGETCGVMMFISKVKGSEHSYSKVLRARHQNKSATVSAHDRLCVGTTVIVKDFLVNLPVRRARIQPALEMQDIKHCLQILSIINYKVSFTLRNDGTKGVILQTQEYKDIGDALRHHCNLSKDHCLIKVSVNELPFKLIGHISRETEPSGRFQFIYVNKRMVMNKSMYKLLEKGLSQSFYLRNVGKEIKLENDKPKEKPAAVFIISIQCPHVECDFTSDPRKFKVEFRNWEAVNTCLEKLIDKFLVTESNLKIAADKSNKNTDETIIADASAQCNKILRRNAVYGTDVKRQKTEIKSKEVVESSLPQTVNTVKNTNNTIDKQCEVITASCVKDDHKPNNRSTLHDFPKDNNAIDDINNTIETEINVDLFKANDKLELCSLPINVEHQIDNSNNNATISEKLQVIPGQEHISTTNPVKHNVKENINDNLTEKVIINTYLSVPKVFNSKLMSDKALELFAANKSDQENPLPFKIPQPRPRLIKRKFLSEHITTESESDITPKRKNSSWDSSVAKVHSTPDISILPFTSREILNNLIQNMAIEKSISFKRFGNTHNAKDIINSSQRTPNQKIQISLHRTVKENQNRNTFTVTQQNSIEYCTYGEGYYYEYIDRSETKSQFSQNVVNRCINTNKHEEKIVDKKRKTDVTQHATYNNNNAHKSNISDVKYFHKSIREHSSTNPKYKRNFKQHSKLFSPSQKKVSYSKRDTSISKMSNHTIKSSKCSVSQTNKDNFKIPLGNHLNKIKPHLKNSSKYTNCKEKYNKNLDVNLSTESQILNTQCNVKSNLCSKTIHSNKPLTLFDGLCKTKNNRKILFDLGEGKQENQSKNNQGKNNIGRELPTDLINRAICELSYNNCNTIVQENIVKTQNKLRNKTAHNHGNETQYNIDILKKNKHSNQEFNLEINPPRRAILLEEENSTYGFCGEKYNTVLEEKEIISTLKNPTIERDTSINPIVINQNTDLESMTTLNTQRKLDNLPKSVTNQSDKAGKSVQSSENSCLNPRKNVDHLKTDWDSFFLFNPSRFRKPLRFGLGLDTKLNKKALASNRQFENKTKWFENINNKSAKYSTTLKIEGDDNENISNQKVHTEDNPFRVTEDESISLNEVSPPNEILGTGTPTAGTCIIESDTDQQQINVNINCDNIVTTMSEIKNEISAEDNRNCHKVVDNDNSLSNISKISNKVDDSDIKLHNQVLSHNNNGWDIETIPNGKVIYVHPKTGMSSFLTPRGDSEILYQFQNRHWFMPKGTSPLLNLKNRPIDSINKLTESERTIVQTIVTENNTDDLARVKWKNNNFKERKRVTEDESISLNEVSPPNEILGTGTPTAGTCIIESDTDQQQINVNINCDNIVTTMSEIKNEISAEDNRNCHKVVDNDNSLSNISKISNKVDDSDIKLHNQVLSHNNNGWDIETIPNGKVIYVHPKTGMSSFLTPRGDSEILYQFQNRHWFMPKGTSPLLNLKNRPIDSINKLTESERTIVQTIVTENNTDDLARVKWKNNNFKDVDNMLSLMSRTDPGVEWRSKVSLIKPCVFSNESLHNAKVIGQVDSKFIAAIMQPNDMVNSVIVLFDQHAVDERVCLENLISAYKKDGKLISEEVNPSIEASLNKSEQDLLMELMPKIIKFGVNFEIQENKIQVTELPLCLLKRSKRESEPPSNIITAFLRQLLLSAEEFRGIMPSLPSFLVDIINSEACRGAIKFGDKLTLEECKLLISKLSQCEIPFQCAHGRPVLATLVEVDDSEPKEPITISLIRLRRNVDH